MEQARSNLLIKAKQNIEAAQGNKKNILIVKRLHHVASM